MRRGGREEEEEEEEVKPTQVRLSRVITFSAPSALQAASRLSVREISLPLLCECVCVCAPRDGVFPIEIK